MRSPSFTARRPAIPARRLTRRRAGVVLAALATGILVAVVLGAGGVFGHTSSRKAVSRYIEDVNAAQQEMRVPLARVLQAYRHYAQGSGGSARVEPELAQAERTLRTLGRRVEAIEAPPDAQRLRTLLGRLFAAEADITAEVDRLVRFTPAYRAVLAEAQAAGAELGKALAAAPVPTPHTVRGTAAEIAAAKAAYTAASARAAAAQADAVDAYDRRLGTVLRRVLALRPPPILQPSYDAQVGAFRELRASGGRLAAELRKADRSRVQALGQAFGASARTAGSAAAQRAEIAAVKAYDSRVRAIGALQGRIRTELGRLQGTLG